MRYAESMLNFTIGSGASGGIAWTQLGSPFTQSTPRLAFFATLVASALLLVLCGRAGVRLARWYGGPAAAWRAWFGRVRGRSLPAPVWKLLRPRIGQVALEMLFVSGLLVFAELLLGFTLRLEIMQRFGPATVAYGFWSIVALVLLAPLVAIWRNCSALSLLLSEVWETQRLPRGVLESLGKSAVFLLMFAWIYLLLPDAPFARWGWLLIVVGAALIVARFSRELVFWHSHVHLSMREVLTDRFNPWAKVPAALGEPPNRENAAGAGVELPSHEAVAGPMPAAVVLDVWVVTEALAGKTLDELALGVRWNLWVVGLQRNGARIINPPPHERLLVGDEILIAGPSRALRRFHGAQGERASAAGRRSATITCSHAE